jgi:hypothetical protein
VQAGGTLRSLRGAVGRADQRKQETGVGEAPVSVLHRLWLLTRTLCILLHSKVSTALDPGDIVIPTWVEGYGVPLKPKPGLDPDV